jgi:hypothetical protein
MAKTPSQAHKSSSASSTEGPGPKVYDYDTLHKKALEGYRRLKELRAASPLKKLSDWLKK